MDNKQVTETILGTSFTMAPQLLRGQEYGMEADIWSIGVVYYQLLYGRYPYKGRSDQELL
jgi:serine/threonine protein kinase